MEEAIQIQKIEAMDVLSLSVLVLFLGMYLNRKFRFLSENYIPPAVTGGLIFSIATWLLYVQLGIQVEFDMRIRDLFLLVFFSTVGLSARMKTVIAGGRSLAVLVVVAAVFRIRSGSRSPWRAGHTRLTDCLRGASPSQVDTVPPSHGAPLPKKPGLPAQRKSDWPSRPLVS